MAKVATSLTLRQIAPTPPLSAFKSGHVKVRLFYLTSQPKHIRSYLLHQHGTRPPYIEDACILLPRMQVFDLLETYMSTFGKLKESGGIPSDAQLQDFKVLDEDTLTLAHTF